MKSKQYYINAYRGIASGLDITGEGAEALIQLLAEATYISEVEHAVITQESSLDKCTLLTSKIQHCMDQMYSVFRGSCPKVILRFRPTKYFDLKPHDLIVTGNNFKVYFLGYWTGETKNESAETSSIPLTTGFVYGPKIIPPSISDSDSEVYTIIGLLAKETVGQNFKTDFRNTYYVECTDEDLSQDMWVKVEGSYVPVTRIFADHIMNGSVFDLTIPSFGSRLYLADLLREGGPDRENIVAQENVGVEAFWYKYSALSSYNEAELRKLQIKGTIPVSFGSEGFQGQTEIGDGVIVIPEAETDTPTNIHYKANRDRYVNSVIRSNSDIGTILEETYPEYVKTGGTSYVFSSSTTGSSLALYYVPAVPESLLTEEQIETFRETRSGYYVTSNLTVQPGTRYTAIFNLDLELYQSGSIDAEVSGILQEYEDKFGIDFRELSDEIKGLISKISNVKQISGFSIDYVSDSGYLLDDLGKTKMYENLGVSYYKVNYVINSSVRS
ncbi:MAG: hypothetical protein J6I84_04940 [Bacilli bacterium]|nr:hypothetical protein [Bacilli bacterium]